MYWREIEIIVEGGKTTHVIDGKESSQSNWLRFVNCARSEEEQNLVAYQYRGDIFYRVYKEIVAGGELLVWYGDEYGEELGIRILPNKVNEDENEKQVGVPIVSSQVTKMDEDEEQLDMPILLHHVNEDKSGDQLGKTILPNQVNEAEDEEPLDISILNRVNEDEKSPGKEGDHTCKHCGRIYSYKNYLEAHLKRCPMLVSYESWECCHCGRKYSSEDYRNVHEKDCRNPESSKCRVNISVKVKQCHHCGKIFTIESQLMRHERIHNGERPYQLLSTV
ncbi:histone-lysine N-methyltransferase PRDM9-like [Paramuricea clavata]|uniref:Histone-lysine N-methyltransferase PRDM9-like n=1 Tax=Paramuricea clavata TaxID=317549 RepID=A0A6S7I7Q8_PARCT|nr:histone-lysine N-methyltransferase PRDM9-like [Paramuricea clavata]